MNTAITVAITTSGERDCEIAISEVIEPDDRASDEVNRQKVRDGGLTAIERARVTWLAAMEV